MTFKDVRPGGRDVVQLEWPSGKAFGLLLLRCDEIQQAHFDAVDLFMRKGQPIDGISSVGEFQREKELQEVYRMLLEPDQVDPKRRLFKTAMGARASLDLNDVAWVVEQHQLHVTRLLKERGMMDAAEEAKGEDDAG